MMDQDTICAVSTPPGEGGIGIIRVSGRDAIAAASKIFRPRRHGSMASEASHTLRYGHVVDPDTGEVVDEALMTLMRAPATYTREDVVEINCHGGMVPLWRTMKLLNAAGVRQADPGEFTKRSFLNGRIDLAQAEAVMDIIRSKTELSHRAANEQLSGGLSKEVTALRDRLISLLASVEAGIDFPEEDIETEQGTPFGEETAALLKGIDGLLKSFTYGKILRDGYATAIVGRPNVGKSSLLNALLKQERAIVTDIPGTTRDVIEEYLNSEGIPLKILDTAGIRETHDMVEQEGVKRSLAAIGNADIVLVVLDGSEPLHEGDNNVLEAVTGKSSIVVVNKTDLPRKLNSISIKGTSVEVSCRTGKGMDALKAAISDRVKQGTVRAPEHAWSVNERHKTALTRAQASLDKSLESARNGLSPEFVAVDLRDALDHIGSIIGATYTDDILERIFNDFCIGK